MWFGLGQLLVGLFVLILGGEFLIQSSVKLARYFKVDPMVIGLTIISFGTSFPELVVSLNAALSGHADISIGNVVGSNIANLALVLGLAASIKPMKVSIDTIRVDWPLLLVVTVVFLLVSWFWEFSLWSGVLFVASLIGYNLFMMRRGKMTLDELDKPVVPDTKGQMIRTVLILLLSLIALMFGSDILVEGAVTIAEFWEVEESVIAVTIIAFGTSVPELATSLIAIRKGELGLGVGNLIGSNIFNILGIIGITSLFESLVVNPHILEFDLWYCLAIPFFIFPFMLVQRSISRMLGILLLIAYTTYILHFF